MRQVRRVRQASGASGASEAKSISSSGPPNNQVRQVGQRRLALPEKQAGQVGQVEQCLAVGARNERRGSQQRFCRYSEKKVVV